MVFWVGLSMSTADLGRPAVSAGCEFSGWSRGRTVHRRMMFAAVAVERSLPRCLPAWGYRVVPFLGLLPPLRTLLCSASCSLIVPSFSCRSFSLSSIVPALRLPLGAILQVLSSPSAFFFFPPSPPLSGAGEALGLYGLAVSGCPR